MKRGLVLCALAGCAADVPVLVVSADEPLPADLHEGDIVQAGDVAVTVPAPGETVLAALDRDDGTTAELAVENPFDGPVRVVPPFAAQLLGHLPTTDADPLLSGVATTAAAASRCSDAAFNLEGFHWASDYHWRFHASSTPSGMSAANVETGLQTAANAITRQRNDCGLADRVSATNSYGGNTSRGPNVSSTGTCGTRDSVNVVGFGALPTGTLGLTCAWFSNKVALEADVKLATRYRWFSESVPSGCSNRFGIEQVGTHEFGHAYGLAHVSQSTHPELTMSPVLFPCRLDKLSLGLGDVRGLRALY
jgi:hypothetical protein